MGLLYKEHSHLFKMLYVLCICVVIFLFMFVLYMEYYKRSRLIQSLHALDHIYEDHYEITENDRNMQRARMGAKVRDELA